MEDRVLKGIVTVEHRNRDGSRVDWNFEYEDAMSWTENDHYAETAFGKHIAVLEPGTSYTIKVACDHLTGASSVEANLRITACPWIIPEVEYEPVTLDFPPFSTLYLVLEPLESDPTKHVKIGKQRFVSHGDSTDFYYTATGTKPVTPLRS